MRRIGEGLARAISFTIDQTFCLAVSITGPMEPEQSRQKTTSMWGFPDGAGRASSSAKVGADSTHRSERRMVDRIVDLQKADTRVGRRDRWEVSEHVNPLDFQCCGMGF